MKTLYNAAIGLSAIVATSLAVGASYTGQYRINSIVVDASAYRGCMASLIPKSSSYLVPSAAFQTCEGSFVSFACDGSVDGITKSDAQALLQQTQLAFVADKLVVVRFSDGDTVTTPEGYCIADRVDVF